MPDRLAEAYPGLGLLKYFTDKQLDLVMKLADLPLLRYPKEPDLFIFGVDLLSSRPEAVDALLEIADSLPYRLGFLETSALAERALKAKKELQSLVNDWSDQSRQGVATARKATKPAIVRIKCPHCPVVGQVAPMHRFHFDNCPKKPKMVRTKTKSTKVTTGPRNIG